MKPPKRNHETLTGYDFAIDPPLPRPDAVRAHCKQCRPESHPGSCEDEKCSLWPYRIRKALASLLSRPKAVREYCIGCQCGCPKSVHACHISGCHLWPYRLLNNCVQKLKGAAKVRHRAQFPKEKPSGIPTPLKTNQSALGTSIGPNLTKGLKGKVASNG